MTTRIGVIGMGGWGKNLVRNFHRLGALHSVCDADRNLKKQVEESYPGVTFTSDVEDLLHDEAISGVVVATPAATHYGMARRAIEAGKDVFVEKPLALRYEDGRELVDLAAEKRRILMVGHILRYHPAVIKLQELISNGELGQIQYLYSNRLNIGKIRTEENILWSFAPHDISVILALLGEEPVLYSCRGSAYLSQDIADATLSEFLFPSGVRSHIFVSWLHPFKEQRMVVVGSQKMAVFEDTTKDKLILYPHKVLWKNRVPTAVKAEGQVVDIGDAEPLLNECSHFVECIETRSAPKTDGEEGLRVLRILRDLQRSLERDGHRIDRSREEGKPESRPYFVHPTAVVDEPAEIGEGTKIWHFTHVMKNAKIGRYCVLGQNCNIDSGVIIGDGVKVQNNVSLYTGTEIEDYVFLGPSCVLTNVTNPRSEINRHTLYEKTLLRRGCTVGANATLVCGITVGRYSFIAAGAVVAKDVPDYAMMVGVPAKRAGWVSRHGLPLKDPDENGIYTCPESGLRYREEEPGVMRCLDLDEDDPLPEDMRVGTKFYDEIVHGRRLK